MTTSKFKIWTNPIHFLATGFGSGLLPKAPGTWGTVVGLLLYLVIDSLPLMVYLAIVITGFVAGVWICEKVSQDLGVHDHPSIVWDEIIGYWITMIAAPTGLLWALVGFALFRFFDIVKPFPIKQVDKQLKGGLGIMLDDVIAGLFSLVILQMLVFTMRWF